MAFAPRSWLLPAAVLCLALTGCLARERSRAVPAVLRGVQFLDARGAAWEAERAAGKTLILNFFFTRCGSVCPRQTRELVELQQALSPELRTSIEFVSISIDPTHDGPNELARFVTAQRAEFPNWAFVAATPAATTALVSQLEVKPPASTGIEAAGDHSAGIYVFDRLGRLMQRYTGAPLDRQRLARDLARLDRVGT